MYIYYMIKYIYIIILVIIESFQDKDLYQYGKKLITSGNVDNAAFGNLVAAAVVIFAVKSKALPGLLKTFFANFLPAFEKIFPKFLKKTT